MKRSLQSTLLLLLFIAVLASAPLLLHEFYVTLLNYIGLYAIVALGLVMLTGVGGLTSFGQAAFVGLGAYTSAYLTTVHGVSPWLTLPAGLLVTGVVALSLGLVTLRLSGHFLPLGTIAWGMSLYYLFGNLDALGGHTGMSGIPPLQFVELELKSGREFFYLIWAVLLLLGGVPFDEEIVMWWNFVGRSHEDVAAMRSEWEAGSQRYGDVLGYAGPTRRIPAPPLPGVRLKPRGRLGRRLS